MSPSTTSWVKGVKLRLQLAKPIAGGSKPRWCAISPGRGLRELPMTDNLLPEQILEGHCYLLRADNGVRVHARVDEITESALEIPLARIRALDVRFYWRRGEGKWSDSCVSLSLEAFFVRAEKEIPCE
jgi:hypothetical protein